ncbi:MFS transporter [Myxococcota bacterium]|nr:MFS transporter [Myxococcota bacterium]
MPDPTRDSQRYGLYVLLLLHLVQVFAYLDRYGLSIALEGIKQEFEVSDTVLGFLIGPAFAIFYAIAGFPLARLADTRSRRWVLAISLGLWSAMTAVCGLARSFSQLAVARVLVGVGEAGGTPPSHSLVSDYFPPHQRGRAMAVVTAGSLVGALFANAGGAIIVGAYGWRGLFFALGVPGILFAFLLAATLKDPPRGRFDSQAARSGDTSGREVAQYLWSLPSFRWLTIAMGMASLTGYGLTFWFPVFFLRVHGMDMIEMGVGLGIVGLLGSGCGTVVSGFLVDRLSGRDLRWFLRLPALGLLLGFPIQVAVLLWPHPLIAMALLIPSGIVGATWATPSYTTAQMVVKPHMRAMAASVLLFSLNVIGVGVGPQLVGILNDFYQPGVGDEAVRYSLVTVSCVNLITAWVYIVASRRLPSDLAKRESEQEAPVA